MFAAGCPVAITETFRSRELQAKRRADYLAGRGAFALPPGQSRHERGEAVDWKRPAATWVRAHPEYGWRFTNPDEWWHTDYVLALDRTLHTLTPPAPTPAPRPDPIPTNPLREDENVMDYLIALYLNRLGRLPDPVGAINALANIASGRLTWAQLDAQLAADPESAQFAALGSEQARNDRRVAAAKGWIG
jgi:hypothetical protein